MQYLQNPNVDYLIIVFTTLLIFSAVVTPGTGVLEILAFGAILGSVFILVSSTFNYWALALIILSAVPFVVAVYGRGRQSWLLIVAIIMLTVGSIFLFATPTGRPAVSPFLAIVTSILADGFLWIAVRKSVQAHQVRATDTLTDIIGQVGEARSRIYQEGSALVNGELWSARSEREIAPGSKVRVTGREGFVLLVEEVSGAAS
jgi:membrane-bound serine protease (ClpP class)